MTNLLSTNPILLGSARKVSFSQAPQKLDVEDFAIN